MQFKNQKESQSVDTGNEAGSSEMSNRTPGISAPKGGGSISSIGEKYQANAVTGTGSMSVPVSISPGRNGFTPQIALNYDSGRGNSEFGMGWNIGIPSIVRKTQKGLPKYQDNEESDVFILAGAEDLVPKLDGQNNWNPVFTADDGNGFSVKNYRPRTEGLHAKIQKLTNLASGIAHWRVTTKDNITSVYGQSATSKVVDPSYNSRVFEWMLEYSYDEKGNIILYNYKKENSDNIDGSLLSEKNRLSNGGAFNKTYLKSICYSPDLPYDPNDTDYFSTVNWHFKLVLDYGEHDVSNPSTTEVNQWTVRQDPFSTFRSGFEIRTYRLCRRFLMFHQFDPDLAAYPYLVKSTETTYDENAIASRVTSIQHRCFEETATPGTYTSETYPPISFAYSEASIDPNIYAHSAEDLENLPVGLDGSQYKWADLEGDGLAGILIEDRNSWYFKRNLGDENYYKDLPANQSPDPEARLAPVTQVIDRPSIAAGHQLVDLDGDGFTDLVVYSDTISGYYKRGKAGQWENFRPFESDPNINWGDPDLRRIDLDGDGFADLIMTGDHCFICYPSKAEEGFGPSYETLQSFEEENGPKIVFSDPDQSVYLADMTGDGLTDIVRIKNGSVCYWPNMGYGLFGSKVGLDNAPLFDAPEIFNQQRVRLADVDGSGTTDIIYIADDCVKYFPNQSGNAFGDETVISQRLPTHNLTQITTLDLMGSGTQCLVWSSPVLGDHPPSIKFINLMGSVKPYLLTEVNNNMGSITRLKYAPSTKFYLRDERAGTPWVTKLPFPVQVVERVEVWDEVNRNRFVTKYAYHHGYFDGVEREFRGFGMVEQWDTEDFTDFEGMGPSSPGLFPPGYNASEEVLHVPPIYTKTWFHTGFYQQEEKILGQYATEYWSGDGNAFALAQNVMPGWDSLLRGNDGLREAARALKGSPLRQEVFSQDGSANEAVPYVVTENTYEIKVIQPRGSERRDRDYASFQVTPAETLAYQYERDISDPRVSHQLTLETDVYGQVLKSAAVVYPRRSSAGYAEQDTMLITISENTLINEADNANFYRLGVPSEAKSYQLTGLAHVAPGETSRADLLTEFNGASLISYDTAPTTGVQKRLLSRSRILYYDESMTATPLAFGSVASHALPYETYQLALTAGQITDTLNESTTRVDSTILSEGAYVDLLSDGNYWIPSGKATFDAANFYLQTAQTDPFGNTTTLTYDSYKLLLTQTTNELGSTTQAQYDYRILQPDLVTDPNGNRQAFEFDILGMVTKLAVMGKSGDSDGDSLADPTAEFSYDLFNWMNNQEPNYAYSKLREEHGAGNSRWMESYAYSNGLGQVVMTKNKVAPGDAYSRDGNGDLLRDGNDDLILVNSDPRWVGSGRTILDNKGNPIKQYEPYFSSTEAYETEAELVEYGVTPIIHYDPLGRAVRTEMPDDTLTRVEFTPWEQKNYDQNDTVTGSLWYTSRNSPDPATDPEPTDKDERAAWLAAKHNDTPQVIHMDVLGRPFVTIDDNATDGNYTMTTELDIEGNPLSITDAKGRTAFTYTYNMLGQPIKTTHLDNGTRYAIANVVGNPLRSWDSRSQAFRFGYDELLRPTKTYMTPDYDGTPGTEQLLSMTVYGESLSSPADDNHIGQPYLIFDSAGMVKNMAFDFKGNPLSSERQVATTYQTSPDWVSLDSETTVSGILTAVASLLESEVFSQSTAYDAQNRPTSMTKPDNSEVLPGYDDGGQLITVDTKLRGAGTATPFVTAIQYNERGQRDKIIYGNGSQTRYIYDVKTFRLTRLLTTKNTGADILQDLNYTYDPVGNIVEQVDNAQQTFYFDNTEVSPNGKYEYDALYRLIEAEGRELIGLNAPGNADININALPENTTAMRLYTESYEYDELGNIEKMIHAATGGNWTRHYHYNAGFTNNLLLSNSTDGIQPADQYTYDAHGNMEAMPHLTSMEWDYSDRLQSADLGGGGDVYYTYDAGGNRARKVIVNGNIIEERIYLGDFEVYRKTVSSVLDTERETLHISDDTGRIALADTLTVDATTVVSSPSTIIRYQLSNHLGSASLELDNTAAIISYEEYHPFGFTSYRSGRNSAETSLKRYRYVGKERDDETGLYYYGARYYAAWLARFISVDPLKDDYPQLNSYNYADNDPVGDLDIDGRQNTKTKKPVNAAPSRASIITGSHQSQILVNAAPSRASVITSKSQKPNQSSDTKNPLEISFNLETKQVDGGAELKKTAKSKAREQVGEAAKQLAEGIEGDRVSQGFSTSQQGKVSKFPTEQRQVKVYRADGTEELQTVTQAKNSGNFTEGDSNRGIKRTGGTKLTKGLKLLSEGIGMYGDFNDLAKASKAMVDGDMGAALAAAPVLGFLFEDINAKSDQILNDALLAEYGIKLFNATPSELDDFLYENQELGLELVYLTSDQIDGVKNGEKLDKFKIDAFNSDQDKIPTIIDSQSEFIRIHATIHQ
ncbi:MAG: SpvB/TcaC N-terminal domain-containing protein [Cyclobacteriaceae bacterium]